MKNRTAARLFRAGSPLAQSRLLVENLLRSHGVDPDGQLLNEGDGLCSWIIPFSSERVPVVDQGACKLVVSIFEAGGDGYLRVSSPILKAPTRQREGFFSRLLSLNSEMVGAALATQGDDVCVVAVRPLRDMEVSQAIDLLGRVCIYACQYSQSLSREFSAPLWSA